VEREPVELEEQSRHEAIEEEGGEDFLDRPVSFTVVAGQTIPVSVHLLCHEAPRTGSVIVNDRSELTAIAR
jgi:hypothetical protein